MTIHARFSPNLLAKTARPCAAGILLLAFVAPGLLGGCAGKGKTAAAPAKPGAVAAPVAEPRYKVTADTTAFYRFGPQQPSGPDLSLKKGTSVLVVKRSFGYSKIKLADSQQIGFVSTEDIAPLTQQELAALAAASAPSNAPVESVAGPGKKSRAIVGEYSLPPQGTGEQERLPEQASTPTPPPNNLFRY